MNQLFIILSIVISFPIYGQQIISTHENANISKSDTSLNIVDSITWADLKNGFVRNNSICHCRYSLDSNLTFKEYSSDCTSEFDIDNGIWKIKNKKSLILKSKEGSQIFNLAKISNCIFFIPPKKFEEFERDLRVVLGKMKSFKSSRNISFELMLRLGNKYFCRKS